MDPRRCAISPSPGARVASLVVRHVDWDASAVEGPKPLVESPPKRALDSRCPFLRRGANLARQVAKRRSAARSEGPKPLADARSVVSLSRIAGPIGPASRSGDRVVTTPERVVSSSGSKSPSFRSPSTPSAPAVSSLRFVGRAPTSGRCSACEFGAISCRCRRAIALSFHGFLVPLQGAPSVPWRAHRGRWLRSGGGVVSVRRPASAFTVTSSTAGGTHLATSLSP